jgi:hypothetical protein
MRRIEVDTSRIGFTAEELAIAGRVAVAIHAAAHAAVPEHQSGKRSMIAKFGVADTLLRIGGWQPQAQAKERWIAWLRETRRCTVPEAHEARVRLAAGARRAPTREYKTTTWALLRKLEEEGRVRYVRADSHDPGLVVWIGDAP